MRTLLIVEPVECICANLKETLEMDYEVYTCAEGHVALEQINRLRPDALIINFHLPYMDGLTVLKKAEYKPPVVLAITALSNPYICYAAMDAGAQYVMSMPYTTPALVQCFRKLAAAPSFTRTPLAHREMTAEVLDTLGLSCYMTGYNLLCFAVPMFIQDPQVSFSKELYPAIADMFGNPRTWQAVEHAIRSVIHGAWKERDPNVWREFFPKDDKPPTNKHFIAAVANKIK